MESWFIPLILFVVGGVAGFVDAIAGGGGLLTVPALLWAGLPVPLALGTNKMQSVCGTTVALVRYTQSGMVPWRQIRPAVVLACAFGALGSWAVSRVSRELLQWLVPVLLAILAGYTLWRPDFGARPQSARLSWPTFNLLAGSVLGFYDGFFGPGTGSFWTVALVVIMGLDLGRATGGTKACNLASNAGSLASFLAAGLVDARLGAIMAAGQVVGARLGSGLVLRRGANLIRPVFISVVLVLTAKLFWDAASSLR